MIPFTESVETDINDTRRRLEVLSDAYEMLASSFDPEETVQCIVRLIVPRLADWCVLDEVVAADGTVRERAVAHIDPDREAMVREMHRRYLLDPDAPHGPINVIRTGEPELLPEITEELLQSSISDPEQRRLIREQGMNSYLCVPLIVRGRTIGALSLASPARVRRYGPEDLAVTRNLSRVAALAIDNARLYQAAHQEIAERKQAEIAARAGERRYRFLAEAIPHIVWTAGPQGGNRYCNQRWYDFTGLSPEQMHDTGWMHLLHPDDLRPFQERWRRSLETGEPLEIEYRVRRASDGAYRWLLCRGLPMRDPGGHLLEWIGTCTDIHDQKRIEQELRESERMARATLDGLTAHVAILDENGVILAVNEAWRRFARENSSSEESVSERANYLQICDDSGEDRALEASPVAAAIRAVIAGERDEYQLVYPCHAPDRQRWFNLRVTRFPDEGSARVVVSHEEITERKQAEETLRRRALELARMARALERSNRELDQFAYVASHDLKAPLRGIANLSRWVEEDLGDNVPEETRHQLELMRGRVTRMEAMVDGLLQYSRIGREQIRVDTIHVGVLLGEVIDLLAPPDDVQITVQEPMPVLQGERLRLQQVFMNLIGNAIKHNRGPSARITISCSDQGDRVEFTVTDNGPGIAPQYHDRIFEIFQTLEARDRVEGTGIGLSLVKKIVEAQGGSVGVDSDQGKGAAFHFTWLRSPSGALHEE